jgi:hypothetical protein
MVGMNKYEQGRGILNLLVFAVAGELHCGAFFEVEWFTLGFYKYNLEGRKKNGRTISIGLEGE